MRYLSVVICLAALVAVSLGDAVTNAEEAIVRSMLDHYTEEKRHVRPSTNTTVNFGVTLTNILSLDERTGTMKALYWLKMSWNDPRLGWTDDRAFSVTFPIERLWKPDIMMWNGLNFEQQVNRQVYPLVMSSGDVIWIPPTWLSSKCIPSSESSWEWECHLKFGSWVHSGWQINLKPYDNSTKVDIKEYEKELSGWEVDAPEGSGVTNKFYDCCPGIPYSHIEFTIRLKKIPGGMAASGTTSLSAQYTWCALVAALSFLANRL